MSASNFEKLQDSGEVSISINTDRRDVVDLKNETEVVYKPTTMDNDSKSNKKFQSLKSENQVAPQDSLFLYRTAFTGEFVIEYFIFVIRFWYSRKSQLLFR